MIGRLSTHVLDTARGRPARGVTVYLYRIGQGEARDLAATAITNADGRTDNPLLSGTDFVAGTYELVFDLAAYLAGFAAPEDDPPFLDLVPIRVTLAADQAYHIPLLFSPFGYSTYRGS